MAEDFMPLLGWDHVELWVGNAKQAAYFYEHAMGFTRTAYAGPETGVRDRASYVLEQGDIRFVVTSALREEHEITKHHATPRRRRPRHRAHRARRDAGLPRGGVARRSQRHGAAARRGRVRIGRALGDRDLRRHDPHVRQPRRLRRPVPAGLRLALGERPSRRRRRPPEHRPCRRQRRARPDGPLGRVLRDRLRDDEHHPFRRRPDPDRVLRAHVEGHVGRHREDQVPDQRAGRGQAQEPDRGVRRVLRRRRRAAHRARVERHRRHRRRDEGARLPLPRHAGLVLRRGAGARRRDRRGLRGAAGATRSSSTATTTAICSRSSRRRRRTGRRCSSR